MARIGIDIDGVCYRFVDVLREYIHLTTHKSLSDMPPAATWNFFKEQWGFSAQEYTNFVIEGVKHGRIFWEGPTYQGCEDVLHRIFFELQHDIVFITARGYPGIEDLCLEATQSWIRSHRLPYTEIIVSNHKTGYNLDVLFDDSPHQVENQILHGENAVIFDQPWNKDLTYPDRVEGWQQLLHYVEDNFGKGSEKILHQVAI